MYAGTLSWLRQDERRAALCGDDMVFRLNGDFRWDKDEGFEHAAAPAVGNDVYAYQTHCIHQICEQPLSDYGT